MNFSSKIQIVISLLVLLYFEHTFLNTPLHFRIIYLTMSSFITHSPYYQSRLYYFSSPSPSHFSILLIYVLIYQLLLHLRIILLLFHFLVPLVILIHIFLIHYYPFLFILLKHYHFLHSTHKHYRLPTVPPPPPSP